MVHNNGTMEANKLLERAVMISIKQRHLRINHDDGGIDGVTCNSGTTLIRSDSLWPSKQPERSLI
jgi:hypothetical protein